MDVASRRALALEAEVAELVDATVSKTVVPKGTCRFESGLRHQSASLVEPVPSGVTVAQGPLEPFV
jgi:hypothetical protein